MKLRYTLFAARELDLILDYLAERSPQGAHKVQAKIQKITAILLIHPRAGRVTSRQGMRAIAAAPYPYLISYRSEGDGIVIYDVRHTARRPS